MKILCVGRNYLDHAKELNNPVPEKPMIFMKPSTALLVNAKPLYYPEFTNDLHYEAEIVLKIGKNGKHILPNMAKSYIREVTIGIDFTARDLQKECKEKGHPWEIAKAFDSSAVVGKFVPLEVLASSDYVFHLDKNGDTVQRGNTRDMIFGFEDLIVYTSRFFKLQDGDLIFTGTPAGVGPVKPGDLLEGFIGDRELMRCEVK